MNDKMHKTFLGILLIASLFLRVANFQADAAHTDPDANRLYLVTSHMVEYGEFPSVGASTGYFLELKRSPLWYYFAAGLLLVKNDIVFPGWVNIFLNLAAILIIYGLANIMFGKGTALISAALFSFSQISFDQTAFYIWEPFVAQTLILLGLLMLFLSDRHKNYLPMLVGILIFSIGSAFYHSAFFVFPAMAIAIFVILRRQGRRWPYFIGAFGGLLAGPLLVHLPVLIYYLANPVSLTSFQTRKGLIPISEFLPELGSLLYFFSDTYFHNIKTSVLSINNVLLLAVVSAIAYSFWNIKKGAEKVNYLIIAAFILAPLVIIAVFQLNRPFHDFQTVPIYGLMRYFLASIAMFIVLAADSINSILSKGQYLKAAKIIFVIILIYVSFPSLMNLGFSIDSPGAVPAMPYIGAIKKEATIIKNNEHFADFGFFQINSYEKIGSASFVSDSPIFWVRLEKDLGARLVVVDDKSILTYKPTGRDEAIFVVCHRFSGIEEEKKDCLSRFEKSKEGYSIKKSIYSSPPYSIYLARPAGI